MNKYVYKVDITICFHKKGMNDKHINPVLYSSKKKAIEKMNSDYLDLKTDKGVLKNEPIIKEIDQLGFLCYHWNFYLKDGSNRTVFFYISRLEVK